jgi:hypothetical protein
MRGKNTQADKNKITPAKCKKLVARLAVLCLLAVFIFAPFTAGIRSIAVMGAYDLYCNQTSLPHALGLSLDMPLQNLDLFPVMVTMSDDAGMSSWLHTPVRFTVDYTIGGYPFLSGHSRFYDTDSPLYGAYIGAYYLYGLGHATDNDTVMQITAFDQRCLALPAAGLDAARAQFSAGNIRQDSKAVNISGYDWQRYDADISTNGPEHQKKGFQTGYLLFGDPPPSEEDYPLRTMAGRIYTTYIADKDLTVGLYILARDEGMVKEIDRRVVSQMRLTWQAK